MAGTGAELIGESKKPEGLEYVNWVNLCELFLTEPLDLIRVAEMTGGKFGKRVQQAVVIRLLIPKITVMIMGNGKFLVCGGGAPEEGVHGVNCVTWKLQKLDLVHQQSDLSISNFMVQNIVCKYYCGFRINVALFHSDHRHNSVYHPQKIQPVRYYPPGTTLVVVMYPSGQNIITGATKQEQLHHGTTTVQWHMYRQGQEYRAFHVQELKDVPLGPQPKQKKCKEPGCKERVHAGNVDYCHRHLLHKEEDEIDEELLEAIALIEEDKSSGHRGTKRKSPEKKKTKCIFLGCGKEREGVMNEFCDRHNPKNEKQSFA